MKTSIIILSALTLTLTSVDASPAKTVEYRLTIAREAVSFTGQARPAMTTNGGIPGPTLRFQEGDEAVIHVHNAMDVDTSIHWHGILLPYDQDGVPYLAYPPIAPGANFTYRFPRLMTFWSTYPAAVAMNSAPRPMTAPDTRRSGWGRGTCARRQRFPGLTSTR